MLTNHQLADALEDYGTQALRLVVETLRQQRPATEPAGPAPSSDDRGGASERIEPWRRVGTIEGFEHKWPEVHEHYGPMTVWESRDQSGPVRLALGAPRERLNLYGQERGWISVWEVINGQPREQRANFIETDNFDATRERIAHIAGKGGNRMAGFSPGEEHLLAPSYRGAKIVVQRDRMVGPYAKNRLGVVATGDDVDAMLDHALAHLRLRS